MQYMRQEIQEWTNLNFWKRAFKKFEVIWSAEAKHITSNIFKATFHKFHLVHSWILCPIYPKDTFNISALILLMAFITGIKSEIRRGGLQVISRRNLTQYFTVECSIYSQIKVFKKSYESWKTTLRKNYSKNVT